MLKLIITIAPLLIFSSGNLIAQKKLQDKFRYRATYQITAQLDSLDKEFIVKEESHLFIGNKISSFSSKAMLVDRTIKTHKNVASTPRNAITEFPFIIIKNKEKDILYYLQKIGNNDFMYEELLNQFDWEILEEYKQIGKYSCQKGTVNWGGRTFIAWFTLELSLTEGPHKFYGLPGIIVYLHDSKGHYKYELTAFEKLAEPLVFQLNLKDYLKVSKVKLKKESDSYFLFPNAYLNNPNVKMSPKVRNTYKKVFKERFEQRNNPIEFIK